MHVYLINAYCTVLCLTLVVLKRPMSFKNHSNMFVLHSSLHVYPYTNKNEYVAVPCRNRRLFRCVFRSHRCVQSAVSLNFREGRCSYALCKLIRYSCIYEARMNPALNRSSAIRRFEHSNAIEIRDGITFDFYTGLPHMHTYHQYTITLAQNKQEILIQTSPVLVQAWE